MLNIHDTVLRIATRTQVETLRYAANVIDENRRVDPSTFLRLLANDLERQTERHEPGYHCTPGGCGGSPGNPCYDRK